MTAHRRQILKLGGIIAAGLVFPRHATPADEIIIEMRGSADGALVWFDPIGLHIEPGRTIRWINRDPGNSHTTTAYHPNNDGHPLRIPKDAASWNSDYLLPDESFSVRFEQVGVYDYFCRPHEHAGMVGRIVVGDPADVERSDEGLPKAVVGAFPAVADILRKGRISPHGG
ncbi:MAG TPA: plastocyanin/azurin family copper-binding protein [Aestuariivirgaceae bacterium]|nr:plastocyanin/azurin family copper-binding protein [Aestuariivirgaceae bacterium]